jgi:hypothetical protein
LKFFKINIALIRLSTFLLLATFYFANNTIAQSDNCYLFYNSKGQLLADTNFTIVKKNSKDFNSCSIGNYFIKELIEEMKYPQMYIDAGIKLGTVIFALTFDSIGQFTCSIANFNQKYNPSSLLEQFEKIANNNRKAITKFCKYYQMENEIYYIPMNFKFGSLHKYIDNTGGFIDIEPIIIPLIDREICTGSSIPKN